MRRLAFIIMFAAAALLMCSCEEEEYSYLPDSHWILHVDGMSEGHRLALTFSGEDMIVTDGSWSKTPPFTDGTWEYNITSDGYLHMYDYSTDSDGCTTTTSYDLYCTMSDDGLSLTLVYDPWYGSTRRYLFDRR